MADVLQTTDPFVDALHALGPEVKGYLARMMRSPEDAEDVWQETEIAAVRHRDQLREIEKLRGWVYAIAKNCAKEALRKRLPAGDDADDLDDAVEALARGPKTWWRRTTNKSTLRDLIDELPLDLKTLVVLRLDRELDWEEVAEVLGTTRTGKPMTAANARQMYARVTGDLRDEMRARGLIS
jgi:RNA polymerase sigma-70 factor (ECF subfamily)